MNYTESIAYLYGLQKHGIKLGLETMLALLARMGSPQARFQSVHIAGTNGKGSTAAMVAAMLQAEGYRVGLYTSPHLVDFRERIKIGGRMIAEEHVSQLTQHINQSCRQDLSPTFFEFTTAMAFQHFADSAIDVAVVEVGLGGRYDATNVLQPVVSAITTIALDHQEYLGSTLAAIAWEKAGVVKPHVPIVIGRLDKEPAEVIGEIAEGQQAPLHELNRHFWITGNSPDRFDYHGMTSRYEALSCPLAGRHQLDNAACALAIAEVLAARGLSVSEKAIRRGLHLVEWAGRLETVDEHPTVVLDGAHNSAAAVALADSLTTMMQSGSYRRLILVLGMMRDKDHRAFMMPLRHLVADLVLTRADLARAATVSELRATLQDLVPSLYEATMPVDALALAKRLAKPDDLICVTGSLMLVGDVTSLYHGCGLSPIRG
ncbi:MAG TPA: folylpolyglutamate synthase/dihydrofolate synthase family protein [Nitrospiraceae bacterium]|jgi:dihydrofolate synthase/folylpolyglutamate synthase